MVWASPTHWGVRNTRLQLFDLKIKNTKTPHDPFNFTKYLCKNIKIPLKAKLLFCLFCSSKCYLTVLGNWKNLNTFMEENQRNVYPLMKR